MELDSFGGMTLRATNGRRPPAGGGIGGELRYGLTCAVLAVLVLAACGDRAGDRAAAAPVGTELGNRAPELRGTLEGGGEFRLADETRGAVIVEFYRGSYCGLCRLQLERLEHSLAHFRQRGVDVIAATAAAPELNGGPVDRPEISFPMVTIDSATLRRWGVVEEDGSGGGTATYVLDGRGVIRFRHVGRNAADRATDAELLTIVEQMASE